MSNPVLFPTLQAPLTASEGVTGLGFVYIGTAGTDPTVLANRVGVTIREEDGTETAIATSAQPLALSAGGSFIYLGAPVQVLVAGSYSMTIQDSNAAQVYYFPTVEPLNSSNIEVVASGSDPAATANGQIYTKLVGNSIELFYQDEDGNITQITSEGTLNLPETYPFPVQVSAPSAVASQMITYSKVVDGNLELFVIDPNGNEIQLTNNGSVSAGEGSSTVIAGDSTTITSANLGVQLLFNSATLVTITLPEQATTTLTAGFYFLFKNEGAGQVIIVTEGTDTLDGISLMQRPGLSNTIILEEAGTPNNWGQIGNDWQPSQVADTTLTAPPGITPDIGAVYIPAATATGSWAGEEDNFAVHVGADIYEFQAPSESTPIYDIVAGSWIGYTGSSWIGFSFGTGYPAINNQAGTTYTALGTDAGNLIVFDNASDCTLTLPEQSTEVLTVGVEVSVIQLGAGALKIAFEGSDTNTGVRILQDKITPARIKLMAAGAPNDWLIMDNTHLVGTLNEWTTTAPSGTPADGTISYIDGTGSGAWSGGTRVFAIHIGSGVWDFQTPVAQYQGFYNAVNTKRETLNTANGTVTASN